MPKKIAGSTESVMALHEKVERLQAELEHAMKQAAEMRRTFDQLRLQSAPGLLRDAEHALNWALGHPDYQPGGKHHVGALGTAAPVLEALRAALRLPAEQVSKPPDAVAAQEEPKPEGEAGEQQTGG